MTQSPWSTTPKPLEVVDVITHLHDALLNTLNEEIYKLPAHASDGVLGGLHACLAVACDLHDCLQGITISETPQPQFSRATLWSMIASVLNTIKINDPENFGEDEEETLKTACLRVAEYKAFLDHAQMLREAKMNGRANGDV